MHIYSLPAAALFAGTVLFTQPSSAALNAGDVAPAFSAETASGKLVSLEDFKGKTVVLEWTNFGCPFVHKHYVSNNMQALQTKYGAGKDEGVVWLSVFSSAPGKQGYYMPQELKTEADQRGHKADHLLRDPTGVIGKAYGAMTTPHMFVVDTEGKVAYAGAIDNKPGTDPEEVKDADNYVVAALTALKKGETPDPAETTPYGCSVKYDHGY